MLSLSTDESQTYLTTAQHFLIAQFPDIEPTQIVHSSVTEAVVKDSNGLSSTLHMVTFHVVRINLSQSNKDNPISADQFTVLIDTNGQPTRITQMESPVIKND